MIAVDPTLEQALALAREAEALLGHVPARANDPELFRIRLARAHALALIDQLAELVGQPAVRPVDAPATPVTSSAGPRARGAHPPR
jgi:hypothetical protein